MVATTNYAAGAEANQVQIGIRQETAWGVPAVGAYQALRFTGESLRKQKTRQRPGEINPRRVQSAAVTTEEAASGGLNFGLSFGTYDELLAAVFCNDWASNKLVNGSMFKSFTLEKRITASQILRYTGAFFSSAQISMQRGSFLSGSFQVLARDEEPITATGATGAYTAPTASDILDPVAGVSNVQLDAAPLGAVVSSLNLTLANEGAAADFGLGSAQAAGMRMGMFAGNGTVELFHRDFTHYERFQDEAAGVLTWSNSDRSGNAYNWRCPVARFMNPGINAGGPGQSVMAGYTLELSADANGVVIEVERVPAEP